MRKNLLFFSLGIIITIGVVIIINIFNGEDEVMCNTSVSTAQSPLKNLAMMLETGVGSGEYSPSSSSEWPTDGYAFNSEASRCENGSTLSWDSENKQVLMSGISSDECYVYFDMDSTAPEIAFSDKTVTEEEVTITVTGVDDESEITSVICYYGDDEDNITTEGTVDETTCTVPSTATYMSACVTNSVGLETCSNKQLATYFIKDGEMLVEFTKGGQNSGVSGSITENDGYVTLKITGSSSYSGRYGMYTSSTYDFSSYTYSYFELSYSITNYSTSDNVSMEVGVTLSDSNFFTTGSSYSILPGNIVSTYASSSSGSKDIYFNENDYSEYTSGLVAVGRNSCFAAFTINIYNIWFQLTE